MILSKQIFQEKLHVPKNFESLETYKLIEMIGLVTFPYSGFPLFLPLGQKIISSIQRIIETEMTRNGFFQIYAPLIQHKKFMISSKRYENIKNELYKLAEPTQDFFLTPTNEEFFLNLIDKNCSYRNLPIKFFQIADKFRKIKKPKGILRSKQFLMCDAISMDANLSSLRESTRLFEMCVEEVSAKLEIDFIRCEKNEGRYVDYLIECSEGETALTKDKNGVFNFSSNEKDISASSIAMYFTLNSMEMCKTDFVNANNLKNAMYLGTYGFGLQRCMHALIHQHRDILGINFPKLIRPFEISILPINPRSPKQIGFAQYVYNLLQQRGINVCLDDRHSLTLKQRASFSDFIGVPYKILIGDTEAKENLLLLKERNTNAITYLKIHQIEDDTLNKLGLNLR